MPDVVVCVEGLSKQYRIGGRAEPYFTLRDSLSQLGPRLIRVLSRRRRERSGASLFWALKDVSFVVSQGEVVGIIGPNGAGKTTLLKILSRVTEPTEGSAEIRGRIASLLEVGTGFHPELTGRENIYLSGAILGMREIEINRKFDDIVAFAEVERFIDTPVKRFSSGMYLRLAFAVAAHLEAEILLVDEVLAVGDANFQRKCLGKMQDVATQGRTVLFVSHNMAAMQRLCNRGIVLRDGRVVLIGSIDQAVEEYLGSEVHLRGERVWPESAERPGNDVVRLVALRFRNGNGEVGSQFDVRDPVAIEIEYLVLQDGHQLCAVLEFVNAMGQIAVVTFDHYIDGPWGKQSPRRKGLYRATCRVPGDLLSEGEMSLNLRIFSPPDRPNDHPHVREFDLLRFTVSDNLDPDGARGSFPYEWGRPAVRPRLRWHTEVCPLEGANDLLASSRVEKL